MKVLLAHPGTQHSHRFAVELHQRNLLQAFHTGVAFTADGWAERGWRFLPTALRRRLANRRIVGLPATLLHCHPLLELVALREIRHGADVQAALHKRNERFQRAIPDAALAKVDAVIGFDTSSWVLAARCAAVGVPLILVQSTCHPDAKCDVDQNLKRRYPAWTESIESRRTAVREAEKVEHDQTDLVVAASSFTRRTLIEHGVATDKIRVNPYGVDADRFTVNHRQEARPFRFVFVGGIGAFKGIPLLLEAWKHLQPTEAELWLVGPTSPQVLPLLPNLPGLRHVGAVPHTELPALLGQCDVLVFPSYFEGFGLVILEAMACGLPVITTAASAGPDIITPGEDGWIMEPGDLRGLVQIMKDCLSNRARVLSMRGVARAKAEKFSWTAYGDRWVQILHEVCGN